MLVDAKDETSRIFDSPHNYYAALNATVPPELRSITVLWDESLLHDCYPLVGEYL